MSGKTKYQRLNRMRVRQDVFFIGDQASKTYHKKYCDLIDHITNRNLVACGRRPEGQGFKPCSQCRPEPPPPAAENRRENQFPTRREVMEQALLGLAARRQMHISFASSFVYVTTLAGEWYFDYNSRPIVLHHKHHDGRPDPVGCYHTQEQTFASPIYAMAYIHNHERAMERRLFGYGGPQGS